MKKIFFISIFIILICLFLLIKIDVTSLVIFPLKKELKEITGLDISIKKIYLRIVPLHIEIENLEFLSNENNRDNFSIKKAKLYLSIYEIFKKEINIKRVSITNSNISLNYEFLKTCINNIENYLSKPSPIPFKVKINSVEIDNFSSTIYKDNLQLTLDNLKARSILKPDPVFKIISNLKIKSPEYPNIDTNIKADFKIKDDRIILNELKIFDIYSLMKTEGNLNFSNFLGEFFVTGKIFLNSLKNFLGIRDNFSGEINLDGKIFFKNARKLVDKIYFDIDFNAKFFLQELMKILKISEKLEGYTEIFNGKLKGYLSDIKITAQAKQKEGNILGIKNQTISTEILYSNGILEFKNGDLTLYGGKAKAYVWITVPKVIEHYVFVEIKKISSSGIFELIKWNPGIAEGAVDGWLLSHGNVFTPKGSFIYFNQGKEPIDVRGRIKFIKGEFESDGEIYKFSSLNFQLNDTNLIANGVLDTKKMLLNFKFQGETKNINEILSPYQNAFSGDAYFNGLLYGKVEDPEIDLNYLSNTLKIDLNYFNNLLNKQSLFIKNLKGYMKYKKNHLVMSFYNSENISISGNINFPKAKNLFDFSLPDYNITFNIKELFTQNLYIEKFNNFIRGKINLSGHIKGIGIIESKIEIDDIFWGKEKIIDKVNALLKYQKNILKITDGVIAYNNQKIYYQGDIDFEGTINISGYSKNFDTLKLLKTYTDKIGAKNIQSAGLKNLNFKISGLYKNLDISLDSELFIKSNSNKIIEGKINLDLIKNTLVIKSTILKTGKLEFKSELENKKWDIKGTFNSTRIDAILSLFSSKLPEDFVLLIDGKFNSSLIDNKINAAINLNRFFTRIYGIGLNNKSPININLKDNNVYFDPITLFGQSTEIIIKGKITDYYDILIEGFTDLRPFKVLFNVDNIKGRANSLVYIYSNRSNPEIAGEVNLENCSLSIRKNIPDMNDINATVTFNENRIIVEKAEGKFAEGNINIGGSIYLKEFDIHTIGLTFNFSNVRWIFSPFSWAYINGEVYLNGTKTNPKLLGTVNVTRGIYSEKIDFIQLAFKSSKDKPIVSKDEWFSNMLLNLKIQGDNFILNNNVAELKLNGDLLLKGTPSNPSLLGWISAKEGFIYFRNNKFQLLRFAVQFSDPQIIRPFLNIYAKTTVSQYNINLNLSGYIDQFNLILSSNPPLSENELINLLVLGQQNGTKNVGIPGTSEATSFVTGQIQGLVEERIKGITGLDLMSVEPGISKTTGSMVPRVTIGKKLLDGKLNVTYSTSTGTTAEHVIKVEYIIRKGMSIVGLRDEIGGISGAVKFRFEFH